MGDRLPVWTLGTFHAAILVVIPVVAAHRGGNLGGVLTGLSTETGFLLFLGLWAVSLWSTARALRGIDWQKLERQMPTPTLLRRGFVWGGASGVVFSLFLLAVIAISAVPFLLIAPVLLVVAAAIGAVVGLALASVDCAFFAVTRMALREQRRGDVTEPRMERGAP
jgi:hypothetical protein